VPGMLSNFCAPGLLCFSHSSSLQDYCGANASAQGLAGRSGRYMLEFGNFIRRVKQHSHQQRRHLFFLSENVIIRNQRNMPLQLGEREYISKAYGIEWDPVELDAKYVSPCHRDRNFFTNIPLELEHNFFVRLDANDAIPSSTRCLQDGYRLAAHWYEETMFAKMPTFWASGGRMDAEEAMTVFKRKETSK